MKPGEEKGKKQRIGFRNFAMAKHVEVPGDWYI